MTRPAGPSPTGPPQGGAPAPFATTPGPYPPAPGQAPYGAPPVPNGAPPAPGVHGGPPAPQAPYGATAPQGTYPAAPPGPYPTAPGAYPPPNPAPTGPPPAAVPAPTGPATMAMRRTPFLALVRVELRKLTGTMSDRILLALGPLVIVGVTVFIHTAIDEASDYGSAAAQISPTFYVLRLGHVLIHAALIKLIAGEWQHRSAQPTLLAQPSRARYFLAQVTVVFMLWLGSAALQLITTLIVAPGAISGSGATYLLGYRIGWLVGVCLLGSLLTIIVALTVSMLIPNAAGALAVYFVTVPVMASITAMKPEVFIWLDPSAAASTLATLSPVEGSAPAIVSLLLWGGLLALAGYRVSRRDLA